MKFDLNMGTSRTSNIRMPSNRKATSALFKAPLRAEVLLTGGKWVDDLFPNFVHEFSDSFVVEIPGATIIMPVRRPRLLGDLVGNAFATTANWTLEDFYYVEELTEV